jgi:hypothetical protein
MNLWTSIRRIWTSRALNSVAWGFLALALAGCLPGSGGTTVKKERILGYKGKALVDPFLAAKRLLESQDYTVETIRSPSKLGDEPATLFLAASSSFGTTLQALDWAERTGGHVVLLFSETQAYVNDHDSEENQLFRVFSSDASATNPVLGRLGITLKASAFSKKHTTHNVDSLAEDESLLFATKRDAAFDVSGVPRRKLLYFAGSEQKETTMAGIRIGNSGVATVITEGTPFRNRYLSENDHADLLVALAQPPKSEYSDPWWSGNVFFLLRSDETIFKLLWRHYWMPVIAVLLLVVFWLWRHLPRFGPLRTLKNDDQRRFSEHLKMFGSFLWRRGQTADLLLALRVAIMGKIQKQHPYMLRRDDADMLPLLAERAGIPLQRADDAWGMTYTKEPTRFTQAMNDLQTIYHSL